MTTIDGDMKRCTQQTTKDESRSNETRTANQMIPMLRWGQNEKKMENNKPHKSIQKFNCVHCIDKGKRNTYRPLKYAVKRCQWQNRNMNKKKTGRRMRATRSMFPQRHQWQHAAFFIKHFQILQTASFIDIFINFSFDFTRKCLE